MRAVLIPTALGLFLTTAANSATIRVPEDYSSVLAGVDAAAAGDSVLVGPGTWTDVETRIVSGYGVTACAFLSEGITLIGTEGADATEIVGPTEGTGTLCVLHRLRDSHGVLNVEGLTLTGGVGDGAALHLRETHPVAIRHCRVQHYAGDRAAVYSIGTDVTITDSVFLDNADYAVLVRDASTDVRDCRFESNEAVLSLANAIILDNEFVANRGRVWATGALDFQGNRCFGNDDDFLSFAAGVTSVVAFNTFVDVVGSAIWVAGANADVHHNDIVGCEVGVHGEASSARATNVDCFANIITGCNVGMNRGPISNFDQPVNFAANDNAVWNNDQDASSVFLNPSNVHVDPRYCDAELHDFHVPEGSLLTPSGNPSGKSYGAAGPGCPLTYHTIATLPFGWPALIDGVEMTTPALVDWSPGSTHEIAVEPDVELENGVGYELAGWSDDGAASHTVTATTPPTNYFATLDLKYRLTMESGEHGSVTPPTGWYPADTGVPIDVIPEPPYFLYRWTGTGNGSYTGSDPSSAVVMREPITEHAEFRRTYPLTMVATEGGSVTPQSGEYVEGQQVFIRAIPDEYHEFAGWVGEGDGSYTGDHVTAYISPHGPVTQTAHFTSSATFNLTMLPDPGGQVTPETGPQAAGETVTLTATPDPGFAFVGWSGVGPGSYSGPEQYPTITMNGALIQRAIFVVSGTNYEFTISASAEDPYVQTAEPEGPVRNLYFWATRIPYGMSAFEADFESDFVVAGFNPAEDVYNLRTDGNLLLVVGGCPAEQKLLGYWVVVDDGGSMCLVPSQTTGYFGALDCHAFAPHLWEEAMVLGFSSDGSTPCVVGEPFTGPTPLSFSQFRARLEERSVVASWYATGRNGAADFALYRSASPDANGTPIDGELRVVEGGFELVDRSVVGQTTYYYRLDAAGRERSEWIPITTPDWPPLVTGISMLAPNPFHGATTVSFGIAEAGRARISVYDVQGRLVTTLLNDEVAAGSHAVAWDGRVSGGVAAAGVYFVRLEAGSFVGSRKLVRWRVR